MAQLSVLQRATKADIQSEPFPHVVIENALPDDLYAELAASFPSPATLKIDSSANNHRWDYTARKVRKNLAVPTLWRDFIAYQSSQAFFDEIASLFADEVRPLYPERFPTRESLIGLRAGVRKLNDFGERDILMDAMISGNTPVKAASSVRSTHVDRGDKLFSGLFYMRPTGYDAVGGDLTISRFKPAYATLDDKARLFGGPEGAYVDDANVEHVRTVTYNKNVLVLFINSLDSLHGVTVRQPSTQTRLFVNLVGEIDPPLYQLPEPGQPARYLAAEADRRARKTGWLTSVKRRLVG